MNSIKDTTYNGKKFQVLSTHEAQTLLNDITFVDGSKYYDFEDNLDFFAVPKGKTGVVLVSNAVSNFENFDLVHDIELHDDLHVLAVVFTKNVKIKNALTSLESPTAPAFIALQNANILYALFEKGLHYVQGNYEGNSLVSKGSLGFLYIKGEAVLYLVYSETMSIFISTMDYVTAVLSASYEAPVIYSLYSVATNKGKKEDKWYPCPNTHRPSDILFEEWLQVEDDNEFLIWENEEGVPIYEAFLDGEGFIDEELAEEINYIENNSYLFRHIFKNAFFKDKKIFSASFHNQLTEVSCEVKVEDGITYHMLTIKNNIHNYKLCYIQRNIQPFYLWQVHYFDDGKSKTPEVILNAENTPLEKAVEFAAHLTAISFITKEAAESWFYNTTELVQDAIIDNTPEKVYQLKLNATFGFGKTDSDLIKSLQQKHQFSDAYAQFLTIQNGLNEVEINEDIITNYSSYVSLTTMQIGEALHHDIRTLFGVGKKLETYYNLEFNNKKHIFAPYFFVIGDDGAGNEYVEVLRGQYKGYIGSIDHNAYAWADTLELFLDDDVNKFKSMDSDSQTDWLCDPNYFEMMIFHAKSIDEFINEKIYITSRGRLYTSRLEEFFN